jgi:cysteine desulfurase
LKAPFPESWGNGMLLFCRYLEGVVASGGTACSSGATTGSHVLKAIDAPKNRQSVRLSFRKLDTAD